MQKFDLETFEQNNFKLEANSIKNVSLLFFS